MTVLALFVHAVYHYEWAVNLQQEFVDFHIKCAKNYSFYPVFRLASPSRVTLVALTTVLYDITCNVAIVYILMKFHSAIEKDFYFLYENISCYLFYIKIKIFLFKRIFF